MSGKAARQAGARGAAAQVARVRALAARAMRERRALAASGELGDELLQKVNGNLKA